MFADITEFFIIVLFGIVIIFLLYILYTILEKMNKIMISLDSLNNSIDKTCSGVDDLSRQVIASIKLNLSYHAHDDTCEAVNTNDLSRTEKKEDCP